MKSIKLSLGLAVMAVALFAVSDASAAPFSVLTYNVRGLPSPPIEDRTAEIAAIGPLLEDFHNAGGQIDGIAAIVGMQELFDAGYFATLSGAVTYPNITQKNTGGPSQIGDGLTYMSDFTLTGFTREEWDMCFGTFGQFGSDCDTNKGLSYATVEVAPGVFVDVYNLHADAGQDDDSRAARRDNISQLIAAINTNSPPGTAVIVMGDTNSRYTRTPNDNIETLLSGAGVTDVWVEMANGGVVPGAGPDNESGCDTDPEGAACEQIDKVFYRSGNAVTLMPTEYNVYDDEFSDGGGDLSDHLPVSVVFDYMVDGGTTTTTFFNTSTMPPTTSTSTTTTSTSSTTSTTMDGQSMCGAPVSGASTFVSGAAVTASDALFILSASVGSQQCLLCVCDVNDSGAVTATDALATLQAAVGLPITLTCPAC